MKFILNFISIILLAGGGFALALGIWMANQPDSNSHFMSPAEGSMIFIVPGIISMIIAFVINKFSK